MDIESFVPPGVLAPLEYNAQAIHLLCDLADGKTRPYAYIECISVEAAEQLIRNSDEKFLAGRRVAFRPVTQKELVLDLFTSLRRHNYHKDAILDSSPSRLNPSRESLSEPPTQLVLFTEQHFQQFKMLFDRTRPFPNTKTIKNTSTFHTQHDNNDSPTIFFSGPTERPFARLISMIVKYPCHAKNITNYRPEEYNQEVDRLFRCALCKPSPSLCS